MALKKLNYFILLLIGAAMVSACTTQKRKDDLSGLGKMWHNTTAHYNGYFNANELMEESFLILADMHEDNYNQVLPMYEYLAVDNPLAVASQMDTAIKKVTVVVNLHPYSQWADDCYLLAGQAMFLKKDYEAAEQTFRFLLNEYPPPREETAQAQASSGKGKSRGQSAGRGGDQSGRQTAKQREAARRQAAKERERYNRQVKKNRRRGASSKSSSSRRPSKDEATPTPTDAAATDTPAADTVAAAPAPGGLIRLGTQDPIAVESDPDPYFLKHRPAYQEGVLWLAKTLIERDNYDGATRLLNQLQQDPGTFDDVRRDLAGVQAYLAIRQRNYNQAVVQLAEAAQVALTRTERARFAYILGQLEQKRGNGAAAYAAFEQVLKNNPPFEMAFGARLNLAQNSYLSGRGSAADAMRNLERMLADNKNAAYQDQIYYAMATLAFAQDQREEGIGFLRKSLASGGSNRPQQAEAYYKLGTLFYEEESYVEAKLYFDSTLNTMPTNDERYTPTERLRDNLSDIALALQTIALKDSLLRVSEMSPQDKAALAERIRQEQLARAAAARAAANQPATPGKSGVNTQLAAASAAGGRGGALQKPSSFFAYDERAVTRGRRAFDSKWGGRPLEDDWRRSNRVGGGDNNSSAANEVSNATSILTDEEVAQILSGIPSTDAEKEAARLEIKKAMFELGRLYRDRLGNNEKAVAILEELNQRFPNNLHELESWYYLYVAYTDLNQPAQAQIYRDKIIDKYAASNFARILLDPNYASEYLNEERRLTRQYDETYALFAQGAYDQAFDRAQRVLSAMLGQHPLKPKYALLMAMCTGSTQGKEAYITELNKVVATYPSTPEQTRAKEILRLLGAAGASLPGQQAEESGAFTVNDADLHYIIIVFANSSIDLNANKITVSDYNRTYHDVDRLRISNVYLGEQNDVPVLVLRRFENRDKAMTYFNGVQTNIRSFINPNDVPYEVYAISQGNYREILKARSLNGYGDFFQANYLR